METSGQPFPSRWLQGYNEQTWKHDKTWRKIDNKKDPQKNLRIGTVSKIFLYCRAQFYGTNFTLIYYVDQDK